MKRDTLLVVAILLVAAACAAALWITPSHADRLYPYLELSRVMESDRKPKDWASIGLPVSAGRFAPSISAGLSPRDGEGFVDGRVIVAVRYKL